MTTSLANTSVDAQPARLTLREQRILAQVIDAARRKPGGHVAIDRFRCSYWAWHFRGRTRWSIRDGLRLPVASGER